MSRLQRTTPEFRIDRLPKHLQRRFSELYSPPEKAETFLAPNEVYQGNACDLLKLIEPNSIALSVWSPPYFVGKEYEAGLNFDDWQNLLAATIKQHFSILKPGSFLVINIADISSGNPALPNMTGIG